MQKVRSSLFYRYLLSYILVFLVPLLAFGVMFQITALRTLSEEADASSVAALRQLRDVLEQRLVELDAMAARITADPRLTVFQLRQSGFSRLEAVRELARYTASSAVLLDIILVPRGETDVFMSTGSMSWDRFVDSVATFDRWPPHLIRQLVGESTAAVMLPVQEFRLGSNAERVMVLVYPIPPRSPHPHATILFMIREAAVVGLMANALPESDGLIALVDPLGDVLVSHPKPIGLMSEGSWEEVSAQSLMSGPDAVVRTENRDGDFSIATVSSSTGDWRFISVVGRAAQQARVTEMRNTLMVFALALAVAGVVVSFWFSWSTYSPIRTLQNFVTGRPAETNGPGSRPSVTSRYSEIEAILAGLNDAYKARDRLASAIERQRPLARAQLLTRLLQGIDEEVFRSLGPSAELSFPYPDYFVFLIGVVARKGTSAWEREAVIQSVSEFSGDDYLAYGAEVHHREAVAVIVNLQPSRSSRSVQRRIVSTAVSRLNGPHPTTPTVAVGMIHAGIRGIPISYVEAMAAGEYTASDGVRTQFFADITGPAARLPRLPLQMRLRLLQAVKEGHVDIALDTLSAIVRTVTQVVGGDEAVSTHFRDLAATLREVPGQLGLEDPMERDLDVSDDPGSLEVLVRSLCRLVVVDRSSSADRLVSHAVEFVERNYGDAGLSLVSVADRLGTSLSHLSRVFKEHTGKTFTEYVSDLRIERMMVMLRSTDLPVSDVVAMVGYQDVPNCIRKFRQTVGVTPGKYRHGFGS